MVWTEGTREIMGEQLDKFADIVRKGQTLQRNLDTEDIVGTAVYLASSMSSFVTGQTIMVDGGTVYR
jgi:enoyl-[acyl-carrier-protein] reductase (NADH)